MSFNRFQEILSSQAPKHRVHKARFGEDVDDQRASAVQCASGFGLTGDFSRDRRSVTGAAAMEGERTGSRDFPRGAAGQGSDVAGGKERGREPRRRRWVSVVTLSLALLALKAEWRTVLLYLLSQSSTENLGEEIIPWIGLSVAQIQQVSLIAIRPDRTTMIPLRVTNWFGPRFSHYFYTLFRVRLQYPSDIVHYSLRPNRYPITIGLTSSVTKRSINLNSLYYRCMIDDMSIGFFFSYNKVECWCWAQSWIHEISREI